LKAGCSVIPPTSAGGCHAAWNDKGVEVTKNRIICVGGLLRHLRHPDRGERICRQGVFLPRFDGKNVEEFLGADWGLRLGLGQVKENRNALGVTQGTCGLWKPHPTKKLPPIRVKIRIRFRVRFWVRIRVSAQRQEKMRPEVSTLGAHPNTNPDPNPHRTVFTTLGTCLVCRKFEVIDAIFSYLLI